MPPRRRIRDQPVARQLIRLLPMLPSPLPVALPRQAPVPAVGPPRQPQRQRQIDQRQRIVHPLRMLLGAPSAQYHRRLRCPQHPRRPRQVALRHARNPFHPFRPVGRHRILHRFKPGRPFRNVLGVNQPVPYQNMQQPVGHRGVAARYQPQPPVRPLRRERQARIRHNQLAAVAPLRFKILHQRRHRFRRIPAHHQNDFRARNVRHRKRQPPVNPKGAYARRRRRRHTKTPVVVNVGRPQRHPGELAQQITLFVGQRTAAKHPHRIRPVGRLRIAEGCGYTLQRVIPRRRLQPPVPPAHQRRRQPFPMRQRLPGRPPLDAQRPVIDRKRRVALNLRRLRRPPQRHPALESAVRTMSVNRHNGISRIKLITPD